MYFGFENITVAYGKSTVLESLTLDVPKGKTVTLIGPNGCGKSSLLKTVFRGVRAAAGQVIYNGEPFSRLSPKTAARKVAYLPQIRTAPPDIDVRTLVSYGRYPHMRFAHRLTKADTEIIDRSVYEAGLDGLCDRPLSSLSGGERQRAWIAMCIAQEPEIFILDEPTTYLDIGYRMEVLELIRRLNRERGVTVLMVLHDLNLAARYSDTLCVIKERALYSVGAPDEVLTAEMLRSVFGIDARILYDKENGCPFFIPLDPVHTIGEHQ